MKRKMVWEKLFKKYIQKSYIIEADIFKIINEPVIIKTFDVKHSPVKI